MPSSTCSSTRSGGRRRRRIEMLEPARSRSPKRRKLTADEALEKYIHKDLRVVLERCDHLIPPSRSITPTSMDPPELEADNGAFSFPSPTSSLASRPPVLFTQEGALDEPNLDSDDQPPRLKTKHPSGRQKKKQRKHNHVYPPLPEENGDEEIPQQSTRAQAENPSINLNGVGCPSNLANNHFSTACFGEQVFSQNLHVKDVDNASFNFNQDFIVGAIPIDDAYQEDQLEEINGGGDPVIELIRSDDDQLIGYRVISDSQKQHLISEEIVVDQDVERQKDDLQVLPPPSSVVQNDEGEENAVATHVESGMPPASPPPVATIHDGQMIHSGVSSQALRVEDESSQMNRCASAEVGPPPEKRVVNGSSSPESNVEGSLAQMRINIEIQPLPTIRKTHAELNQQRSSQPGIPFAQLPVGAVIRPPPDVDDYNQNEELVRLKTPNKQLGTSVSVITAGGAASTSTGARENPIVLTLSPQPSTSKSAYMPPPPSGPVKVVQRTTNQLLPAPPNESTVPPALPAQNGISTEGETREQERGDEAEFKIFCDFQSLSESAKSVLLSPPPTLAKIMWYCCVLWDTKLLQEFEDHQECKYQLHTSMGIGKLLSDCLQREGHSWPGVAQMNYKRPFIALDIINNTFGRCGAHSSLRVQEVSASDTICGGKPPRLWELVVLPECKNLAEEMVRLSKTNVKTTVILWGAQKDPYREPWEGIEGEILLKPTNSDSDALSVLIFHQEKLSKERGRYIHGPFPESELWDGFQNPDLDYRTFIQVELDEYPLHLSVHAKKMNESPENQNQQTGQLRAVSPVNLFPSYEDLFEDEEDDLEEDVASDFESSHLSSNRSMDEEDWDEFRDFSLSRAGSSTPPGNAEQVLTEERKREVNRDLEKLAERMFARPPYVHTASNSNPVDAGANQENGQEIALNSSQNEERVDDLVNGNAPEPIVMLNGHGGSDMGAPVDEMEVDDLGVMGGMSDSQGVLVLSGDLGVPDIAQLPPQGETDNQLEESFVTCDGSDGGDFPSVFEETITPLENGVVNHWGKGCSNKTAKMGGHHDAAITNGQINGTAGTKRAQQPELMSFSETSQQYKLSELIDEL